MERANLNTIEYAGFNKRMFSAIIDSALITVLLMPIFAFLAYFIYFGQPPAMVVLNIAEEAGKKVTEDSTLLDVFINIANDNRIYDYFMTNYGLLKMVVERFLQMFIVGVVVIIFWLKKQATPGKMLLSTRIVDAKTHKPPTRRQYIIRFLAYFISSIPFFLGFFWMIFDKKKQTWHDKLAGTVVIKGM
jgi:uncharacterized RDD family membrane protein YckC